VKFEKHIELTRYRKS